MLGVVHLGLGKNSWTSPRLRSQNHLGPRGKNASQLLDALALLMDVVATIHFIDGSSVSLVNSLLVTCFITPHVQLVVSSGWLHLSLRQRWLSCFAPSRPSVVFSVCICKNEVNWVSSTVRQVLGRRKPIFPMECDSSYQHLEMRRSV